jgi:hypothetical protein
MRIMIRSVLAVPFVLWMMLASQTPQSQGTFRRTGAAGLRA